MARDMVQVRRSSSNRFAEVPKAQIPRSQFDRSHGLKTTFDVDRIVPIMVEEVLPGDTHTCKLNGFARVFSPLQAPIMDNLYVDFFFFYVPSRLLWTNWEKFNGAQDDPGDSTDYVIPTAPGFTPLLGTLADYMGLPLAALPANEVSALPFRAYWLIYNEWFRDENLIDSHDVNLGDSEPNTLSINVNPAKRAKKHDYFTSCLPWPQKGDAVSLPIGSNAPVTGLGVSNQTWTTGPASVYESTGALASYSDYKIVDGGSVDQYLLVEEGLDSYPNIFADLSAATAATINDLRLAFQLQKLLERDARGGTRYVEILKAHFGVTSPDFRLQRPEFLGGGSSFINVSPVAQTSETGTTPQANLSGIGTGTIGGVGFAKSFVEHGYIIGLASARPDLTYQQGLPRMWSRSTRYDFYWPALARIGEQAVLNKELYFSGGATVDNTVFGYQERYAEYRYAPSRITGKFRSDAAGTLDRWHLAQDFSGTQLLNQAFIEYDTPMDRVQAVTTEPDLIVDLWFDFKSARPMPVYGVPGLIDHF